MTGLSLSAQAVLDALKEEWIAKPDEMEFNAILAGLGAAALRAAADQILLVIEDPEFFVGNCCERAVRAEREDTCDDLLRIADELAKQS